MQQRCITDIHIRNKPNQKQQKIQHATFIFDYHENDNDDDVFDLPFWNFVQNPSIHFLSCVFFSSSRRLLFDWRFNVTICQHFDAYVMFLMRKYPIVFRLKLNRKMLFHRINIAEFYFIFVWVLWFLFSSSLYTLCAVCGFREAHRS